MAPLKKANQEMQNKLLHDIEQLQWSVNNESTFRHVFSHLEEKYKSKYKEHLFELEEFFAYMRDQWINSPVFR